MDFIPTAPVVVRQVAEPSTGDVRTVRKWGDPVMVKHGYTTVDMATGNFGLCGLIVEDEAGRAHSDQVGHSVELDRATIDKIASLQYAEGDITVDRKMRWLMNGTKGRPMWFDSDEDKWQTADRVYYGPMAYMGQKVQIGARVTVFGTFRAYKNQNLDCYEVTAFVHDDWGKTYASHPYLVQKATGAFKRPEDNTYTDSPMGTIFVPMFAPTYGRFRGLSGYQPKRYLILAELLVP